MKLVSTALAITAVLAAATGPARGQIKAVDDILAISKGQVRREQARTHQHLAVQGAESPFAYSPGSGAARLGEPVLAPIPGVLASAAGPPGGSYPGIQQPQIAPPPRLLPTPKAPAYSPLKGPLELPSQDDEGPAEGLTLDAAIEQLAMNNYDLQTKFQEIPKADADILSAGLRLNPLLFASVDDVPYGSYSPQRPGETTYAVTVAQPIDINQKRKVRVRVAQQARQVLEAQYQDAVRLQIDQLYAAFVDVLEARQAYRAAQAAFEGLSQLAKATQALVDNKTLTRTELDRARIQQYNAELAVQTAQTALAQAKRSLATMLAIPPQHADLLEVRGAIRADSPPLPATDALIHTALAARPDLMAFRLGVQRAQAGLQLAKAERIEDIFAFYTPYTFINNVPQGGQNVSSWSVGLLLPLPVFNRNQGNISRNQVNVAQTQIELTGLERQVANEVQRAVAEYETSAKVVQRFQEDIHPAARRVRDDKYRLFTSKQESLSVFLEAQREYNEVVRQFLDAQVRHRRNTLRLNTVVGQRLLP